MSKISELMIQKEETDQRVVRAIRILQNAVVHLARAEQLRCVNEIDVAVRCARGDVEDTIKELKK